MLILELALISLIILTILTQDLTIRIYDENELCISLSLTIFSLEFKESNNKAKRKRKRKMSLASKVSYYSMLLRLFASLVRYSKIRIYKLAAYSEVARSIPRLIGSAISIPALLAYIYSISERFELEDGGAIGDKIDASIDIPLVILIISLIKMAYFRIKLRFAEGVKNA